MAQIGSFAARAEQAGFESVGVIDRLVYDNLDPPARNDTLTSAEDVRAELARLAGAGCTDVVLYPCSGDLDQIERLSQPLRSAATVPDA
jgi:hypothetical protein